MEQNDTATQCNIIQFSTPDTHRWGLHQLGCNMPTTFYSTTQFIYEFTPARDYRDIVDQLESLHRYTIRSPVLDNSPARHHNHVYPLSGKGGAC